MAKVDDDDTGHDQVELSTPWGERVEVDAGIADLLADLWAIDIETDMSCEDVDGCVWLSFPSGFYAERFLTHVLDGEVLPDDPFQPADLEGLVNRVSPMVEPVHDEDRAFERRCWRWQLLPIVCPDGPQLTVGVWFPHSDLPLVRERIRAQRRAHND
jgi:hypothetical protein